MCDVFAITLRKVVNFSLKAKLLKIKSEGVGRITVFLVLSILFLSYGFTHGQVEKTITAPIGQLAVKKDTNRVSLPSSKVKKDTLLVKDSIKQAPRGAIQTTIFYSAKDSINSSLERKIVRLYGDATVKYGDIELEAEEITIDYEQSTISASGKLDSLGQRVGYPVFKNGVEVYETRDMVYNFKNKSAKISEVVTKQGDAVLHGDQVYKNERNELFSIGNAYTTCNLRHPHFRIISTKTKAIPGDKMVSGPFYMELNDVPTPLAFPFGIFPSPKKSASGILVPTYGEERNRGFFLRNGGYFFDISEYFKLALTGDIYSKGSSALYVNSSYNKRYHYSGTFNFSSTSNRTSSKIEDEQKVKDYRITWSHTPQTKGTGRFSASVNAATATFNNNNFLGVNTNPNSSRIDNTTRKLSSNISYSKTFAGTPFSLGTGLRINQDLVTKQVDLPFPDVNFNINNIYPFKKVKDNMFLENLSVRLTTTATNQITNNLGKIGTSTTDSIAPFLPNLPTLFENARKGVRHNVPLATSLRLLKFFTLSPSLSWDEIWYVNKLTWGQDSVGKEPVVKDTIKGFNRISNYSGSIALTTRIFGTYFFKKGSVKAIRHVINPSIGYSFQPDFADPKYGYYQTFDVGNATRMEKRQKSRHEGANFVYGQSRAGKSSSLGFSLNNNVEMKVRNKKDTVDKKISLFNTLSASSGYNFAADSFKLSNIGLAANTNILNNKINLNLTATLDPYQYWTVKIDENTYTEIKVSRYAWQGGKGLGQISSANLAFSTNFNPKGQTKDNSTRDKIGKSDLSDTDKQFLLKNPDAYVDFNIPWNLRLSYNANYTKTGSQSAKIVQAAQMSGDFSLTKKWKITYSTGYDFQNKALTQTFISINRDLHCWQTSLSWTPFGKYQSYSFSIGIKSAMLQDLKLDRNRNFLDN